jgi:glutaredoxin
MTDTSRIRFYTRQGCPLCDEALAIVNPIAQDLNVPVDIVDVDLDLALMERYNERVPVVEIGGAVVAEGSISEHRTLYKAVKRALRN